MKANKWVAMLATCSVLAVAAPVSAQFGGLGSLKKKLETVAKELEKPKPAPQPQPTARPTPPQSRPATSQGGYASPAPAPQPQTRPEERLEPAAVDVVATPPRANAATIPAVAATEIWYCTTESSGHTTRLEFRFFKNDTGRFFGTFKEYYRYEDGELTKSNERSGRFTRTNNTYNLIFNDKNRSRFDVYAPESDDQKLLEIRYSHFDISESFAMIEYISPERAASAEEAGGDTDVARCRMSKHMFFDKSFDEYVTSDRFSDDYIISEENYRTAPKPNFIGRDKAFASDKDGIISELKEYWNMPIFAQKYFVYQGGDRFSTYLLLIERDSGKIFKFADMDYDNIDHIYQKDSKLIISLANRPESGICFFRYGEWVGDKINYFLENELPFGGKCNDQTFDTRPGDSYWTRAEVSLVKGQ
jgi:hypothetical protein